MTTKKKVAKKKFEMDEKDEHFFPKTNAFGERYDEAGQCFSHISQFQFMQLQVQIATSYKNSQPIKENLLLAFEQTLELCRMNMITHIGAGTLDEHEA